VTARSTWKAVERRAAAIWHSRRAPLSGSNGGQTASDSLHPRLFLEVKLRERSAVRTLFDSTAALAKKEGKTPVLMLADKRRPGFLVVFHSDDLPTIVDEAGEVCT
jgi:hypothetical protein